MAFQFFFYHHYQLTVTDLQFIALLLPTFSTVQSTQDEIADVGFHVSFDDLAIFDKTVVDVWHHNQAEYTQVERSKT